MSFTDVIKALRQSASVSVPFAGRVLAGLTPNGAYEAAKRNALGVPVFRSGKRLRVASVHILEKIGVPLKLPADEPDSTLSETAAQAADEPETVVQPVRKPRAARASRPAAARSPPVAKRGAAA
jgi:hypothetical protein